MESTQARQQFGNELLRRFEEMQQWAIANWPESAQPLAAADFAAARKSILTLVTMTSEINRHEAEPAEGGAQYVDVTPAPWP